MKTLFILSKPLSPVHPTYLPIKTLLCAPQTHRAAAYPMITLVSLLPVQIFHPAQLPIIMLLFCVVRELPEKSPKRILSLPEVTS